MSASDANVIDGGNAESHPAQYQKQQRQDIIRETDVLERCAILENIDALERCATLENIEDLERCASLEALDVLDERMLYLLYFRFHQNKGVPLSARPCPVV